MDIISLKFYNEVLYPLVLEHMHVIVKIYIISHNVRILTFRYTIYITC